MIAQAGLCLRALNPQNISWALCKEPLFHLTFCCSLRHTAEWRRRIGVTGIRSLRSQTLCGCTTWQTSCSTESSATLMQARRESFATSGKHIQYIMHSNCPSSLLLWVINPKKALLDVRKHLPVEEDKQLDLASIITPPWRWQNPPDLSTVLPLTSIYLLGDM